jgi:hypothetical protein
MTLERRFADLGGFQLTDSHYAPRRGKMRHAEKAHRSTIATLPSRETRLTGGVPGD